VFKIRNLGPRLVNKSNVNVIFLLVAEWTEIRMTVFSRMKIISQENMTVEMYADTAGYM
jgi:hypothetical protein